MWQHTLRSLAEHLGCAGEVVTVIVKVDRRCQWKRLGDLRYNFLLRSIGRRPRLTGAPPRPRRLRQSRS